MTAKMGIDATIPEGLPPMYYERIKHAWLDDVEYRTILQAWGVLREQRRLGRDEHGLYLIRAK